MKSNFTKVTLYALLSGFVFSSCSKEVDAVNAVELDAVSAKAAVSKSSNFELPENIEGNIHWTVPESKVHDFEHNKKINAVAPSECGATPFNSVTSFYNDQLITGFIGSWDGNPDAIDVILGDYFIINQIAALDENKNADTFGANGEYTNYVNKRVRSLEKFWDMPDLITVRGQHTSTLEDLDFIRSVYENYTSLPDFYIDYLMSIAEHFNTTSDQIPENPFYASDGFATFSRYIVVGDGIVSMLSETGLDPKVVWSSILAHEWAHQLQFLNFGSWNYPLPPFIGTPESTRMTELEADFITGFYLTHKRGATYNWKRVEDALSAFYNIGDCGFTSDGHHGTPLQRLEAAKLGYELAQSAKKNGQILSQRQVHTSFLSSLSSIVGETTGAENTPNAFQ